MSSQNLGETQGKPDYGIIFDDFPNAWDGHLEGLVISGEWRELISQCHARGVTYEDILKAREYGVRKYARMNWAESIGTDDHENFMAANKRSIYRHLVASRTEMVDHESGCKHMAMVALRCLIAIQYDSFEPMTLERIDEETLKPECVHLETDMDGKCFECGHVNETKKPCRHKENHNGQCVKCGEMTRSAPKFWNAKI